MSGQRHGLGHLYRQSGQHHGLRHLYRQSDHSVMILSMDIFDSNLLRINTLVQNTPGGIETQGREAGPLIWGT